MKYLYHHVPKNFTGTILYPLNSMKDILPEIYTEHITKYEGREDLPKRQIPLLDCLWNDVLHLTAVEPQDIKANLKKAGVEMTRSLKYFKIPIEKVVGKNTVALLYRQNNSNDPYKRDYELFDPNKMEIYSTVPEATIEYYRECVAKDERPLTHNLVSHVLYKGTIDTTGIEIVAT